MTYTTKHGLSVHKGRFCKGRRTARKPSRKGSIANRINTRMKVEKHPFGNNDLKNIYAFTYLGAEIPGGGDPLVPVKHRCDVAWGRFGSTEKH